MPQRPRQGGRDSPGFWKLVDMNGGWTHHKYIRKKRRPFGLDDSATVWVGVGSVREIMPQCILDLVRRIYPNPPEQPYMGLRVSSDKTRGVILTFGKISSKGEVFLPEALGVYKYHGI